MPGEHHSDVVLNVIWPWMPKVDCFWKISSVRETSGLVKEKLQGTKTVSISEPQARV